MLVWLLTALAAGPFDTVDSATTTAAKVDALVPLAAEEATAAEAYSRLGSTLAADGKPALAVLAYAKALALDPEGPGAAEALALAQTVGDVDLVALALQERKDAPGEGDAKSQNAYLVARALLRDGQLSRSEDWLKRVGGDTPAFADAESLRGVVLAQKGKHTDALVPLQTARALGKTLEKGRDFDDRILMNLARSHYADKNYGQAIYHYALVPRDSLYWPEARFEKAWAHFRAQDAAGALGELQTHQSPFFDELWFPEAWMLRAQSLFVMCRYGAAIDAMDAYEGRYKPVLEELERALGTMDDRGAWTAATTWLDGGTQPLPEMVLRAYRGEDRLASARTAVAAYRAAATDTSGLGTKASTLAGWATARADAIEKTEGDRIFQRVKSQRTELGEMMAGLELARVDILDRESRMYERAAATGTLEPVDRKAQLKKVSREKKGFRVWPFEGEYWLDELGWYQISALSMCPDNQGK